MTDDMQRAREFINQDQIGIGSEFCGFTQVVSLDAALEAIAAALRAAPEIPQARVTEPLRADESQQEQADAAAYTRGWNDCRNALVRRPT